jgi:hypothetical protein
VLLMLRGLGVLMWNELVRRLLDGSAPSLVMIKGQGSAFITSQDQVGG